MLVPLGEVPALGSRQCDLSDLDGLCTVVRAARPDLIVNAAAHTAVDRAEQENELAPRSTRGRRGAIAEEARRLGALMVHYSTDFVRRSEAGSLRRG